MITPADLARMLAHAAGDHTQNPLEPDTLLYTSEAPRTPKTVVRPPEPRFPTPAMMPQRRAGDGPTTFASLDAQELPMVREYSAGGLVFDERGRVAIIARHSRNGHLEWCLPKGHIEKGETPQQTAVREVHEETGILGEVVESIATIDYWFTGTSQRVHKLVHHFALRQIGGELTVDHPLRGHSFELRITSEDPATNLTPSSGTLERIVWPSGPGLRIDTGVEQGDTVSPKLDSMMG